MKRLSHRMLKVESLETRQLLAADLLYYSIATTATPKARVAEVAGGAVTLADNGSNFEIDVVYGENIRALPDVDSVLTGSGVRIVSPPANGQAFIESSGRVLYLPNTNFSGTDRVVYRVSDGQRESVDALVTITVSAVLSPAIAARTDVNVDGNTTPMDALLVINSLNNTSAGEGEAPLHDCDVNDDGVVSPIDALLVINRLNELAITAESESISTLDEWFDDWQTRKRKSV